MLGIDTGAESSLRFANSSTDKLVCYLYARAIAKEQPSIKS